MPPSPLKLLDALFATVARKTKPMPFREGAATARYLSNLAYEMSPGPERERILRLSEIVWGRVFQFAEFRTAGKEEAIQLLEEFSKTHLVKYHMPVLIESVRAAPAPKPYQAKPVLASPLMAVTMGPGSKRLPDDLTERIYAGYWALRFGKVANARRHVAEALQRADIPREGHLGDQDWTSYDVGERLKQYDATTPKAPDARKEHRQGLVEKWQLLCAGVRVPPRP